jgi:mRNA interferase MazF
VIVSNDGATTTAQRLGRGVIAVVPITSNIDNVYPFQTLLPSNETGLDLDSKAQAEQVRSVAIERIGSLIGTVPFHLMDQLVPGVRSSMRWSALVLRT